MTAQRDESTSTDHAGSASGGGSGGGSGGDSGGDSGGGGITSRWFYRGIWHVLVDWFRVPAEPPTLPAEPGEEIEAFQPDSGFLDYLKLWFWLVAALVIAAVVVAWLILTIVLWWVGIALLPLAFLGTFLPIAVGYVGVHLRFDTTWYVMTQRSLRIRRGIWQIHEMTITYENVQNVKMEQGPIQRYFGIGSLVIETAGGGSDSHKQGGFSVANRAVIEGVTDVQRLRDIILTRLQASRTTGLGDETTARPAAAWSEEHVQVLREIREACRAFEPG